MINVWIMLKGSAWYYEHVSIEEIFFFYINYPSQPTSIHIDYVLKGEGNKNMKIPHNVSVKSYLKKRTLLLSIKNSKLTNSWEMLFQK